MRRLGLSIFVAIGLATILSNQLSAADRPMTPDEYVERLPFLHAKPTLDTTPVKIRVGHIIYAIPRNYIKKAVELMPTLWITYPQFQPPTPQTRCSSEDRLPVGPSECVIVELTIHGNIDPQTGRPTLNSIVFDRMIKDNPTTRGPFPGPSGLQFFTQGSYATQNRSKIFKSDDNKTLFYCDYFDTNPDSNGLCIDEIALDDDNAVHVFFSSYLVPYAPDFESRVRALVASFKTERTN